MAQDLLQGRGPSLILRLTYPHRVMKHLRTFTERHQGHLTLLRALGRQQEVLMTTPDPLQLYHMSLPTSMAHPGLVLHLVGMVAVLNDLCHPRRYLPVYLHHVRALLAPWTRTHRK